MALTRAQLLAGNSAQGVVLPGQVQAVTAGAGISIDASGVISVNAATTTGLVKLNNGTAYNSYVWPNTDGAANTFLQTNGAGVLTWTNANGFAVVTVSGTSPTPVTEGELWYDCNTGALKVYQSCVAPAGWTNVAQPGLPVLPANTSSVPAFSSGSGTSGDPYVFTISTVGAGGTAVIVNTVTVTGLAPGQYVPIVDLNAAANGGRYSFTNNYADGAGSLVFQTIFDDSPASAVGTSYVANIRVGYATVYIQSGVSIVEPVSLPNGGTLSGNPYVGSTITYTPAVASGGVSPFTYTWTWKKASNGAVLKSGSGAGPDTYVIPSSLIGDQIYVQETVTDANGQYATASTSTLPASPGTIQVGPFPSTTINFPTTLNGTANTTWNEAGTTAITGSDCIEFSINGGPFSQSGSIISSQTLTTRWLSSAPCGGAADGTTISGTIAGGSYQQTGSITIDRIPETFPAFTNNTNVSLNSVSTSNDVTPTGYNGTTYVTYNAASTGSSIQGSTDGGTNWTLLPTSGTSFPLNPGQSLRVRMTVGGTTNTGYTAIINLGISGSTTSQTFTATTTTTAGFPNLPSSLATGPTQIPQTVSGTWADGAVSLISTGCIQISLNGSTWGAGPLSMTNGTTLYMRWDPTGATCGAAIEGTTITGTITGAGYTNSYSLLLDRSPSGFTIPAVTGQALSSVATSSVVTLAGTNAPAYITYAAGSPDTLTSLQVSVAGGAYVTIPTSGTTVSADPGATLQFKGTVGGTNNTAYTATINIGTSSATWSVTTVTVTPSIQTPSIQTPANNATGVGTASGVTITGSTYTPLNGAGATQTSSTWEVYKDSYPLTSTNTVTAVTQNPATAWTARTSGTTNSLYGLVYANSLWMTTGNGDVLTSPDAVTWTSRATAMGGNAVAYGNGRWITVGYTSNFSAVSTDGTTWNSYPTGTANNLIGIASDGTTFVAVGAAGTIRTTSNSISWTGQTSGTANSLNAVTYANSKWVAVGVSGTVRLSTNGTTWTGGTSGTTETLYEANYGNGLWVAVGTNGSIITSSDNGSTWTTRTSGTANTLRSVYYANGTWTAVGLAGTLLTSGDGITWSTRTSGAAGFLTRVYNSGSLWTAVGQSGDIRTSASPAGSTTLTIANCQTDGFLVNDSVTDGGSAAGSITSVNNTTVVVAPSDTDWGIGDSLIRASSMYSAVSGSPFTKTSSPRTSLDVAKPPLASNTTYYTRVQYATTNTSAATSSFSSWSKFTTGSLFTTKTWSSFAVSAKMGMRASITSGDWIILQTNGNTASYATSSQTNPASYNSAGQTGGNVGNWLGSIGSTLFVVGDNGYIGKTPFSQFSVFNNPFTTVTSGTSNKLNYISDDLIVGNSGTILTSADSGTTWTLRTSGTTNNLLACMNSIYDTGGSPINIAVGAGGVIRTSTDGITWTTRTSGTTQDLYGVWCSQSRAGAPTSARYVVVGANGTILTSPDGTTWTSRTSGTTQILRDCVYDAGLWWVVGDAGTILYSETCASWTAATSNTTSNLTSITKNTTDLIAYGTTGSTSGV